MSRIIRAALTETINQYGDMPTHVDDLGELADRLDQVREANVQHHVELIRAATRAGAKIVGMGELFPAPYFALHRDPMWFALAEDAETGPTIKTLCEVAFAERVILVAPIYELDASTGRRFDTAVVIDETGDVLGKYRKTHIPTGKNEQASFDEKYYYDASNGNLGRGPGVVAQSRSRFFPVFQTRLCRIGVSICYDRHFPEVAKALAAGGAELVFSPAVTFGAKSERMWELEFAVDAARHKLFFAGSNRRGQEPPWNQPYFGGSHFVGPNGKVPALAGPEHLVICDLDLDELGADDPSGWNFRRDARPEIY